ncbi:MAG: 7-carboxy-7-deazaguanine synthase QueE [Epsilonproteobacteria bacterium]|nr:7-carboxy-7-deazaguanine synthase QueE [Campylobacterota bacterium]
MKLPVSETFYSIQGEGVNVGRPALFIRVYGCNKRCIWCDSSYSYEGGSYSLFSEEQIIRIVEQSFAKTVVLTGGEPAIYHDFFSRLINLAPAAYFMETNGTIWIEDLIEKLDFISISPKLSSSGADFDIDLIKRYVDNAHNGEIKFVIADMQDMEDATGIINALSNKKNSVSIVFQPAEISGEDYLHQIQMVYQAIMKNQFLNSLKTLRFIPQVHKLCNLK